MCKVLESITTKLTASKFFNSCPIKLIMLRAGVKELGGISSETVIDLVIEKPSSWVGSSPSESGLSESNFNAINLGIGDQESLLPQQNEWDQ